MKRGILVFVAMGFLLSSCSKPQDAKGNFIHSEKSMPDDESSDESSESDVDIKAISPQDGGFGFEKIAQSLGYQTNVGKDYGNPNATKGGTWHTSLSDYPNVLRPLGPNSNTVYVSEIMGLVYSPGLFNYNLETNQWERGIADYWKFSDDGKTLWLRINPNVKFSDGKHFTVDDIIASHELEISEDLGDPMNSEQESKYTLTKLSPLLLKVDVQEDEWKNWMYFGNYYFPASHLEKIDAKVYLEKYATDFMPSLGPYLFDKEKSKDQELIVLKRNPNYYGYLYEEGKNLYNFDSIEYKIIRDDKIEKETFKKGDIDYYASKPADWYDEFSKQKGSFDPIVRNLMVKKVLFNAAPKGRNFFVFNTRKKPFDDVRIRKAIAMGFNKDIAIEKIMHNDAVRYFSLIPLSKWGSPNVEKYDYNPEMSSKLLEEAGYNIVDSDGIRKNAAGERLEFEVALFKNDINEQTHTMFQDDMKKIGIKINLAMTDFPNVIKKLDSRDFNIIRIGFSGIPFPNFNTELKSSLADQEATNNMGGFKSNRVDELIIQYDLEKDAEKRYEQIHEIDEIVSKEYVYLQNWIAPYTSRYLYWNKFGTAGSYTSESPIVYWYLDKDKETQLQKAKADTSIVMDEGDLIVDRFSMKPADLQVKEY